MVMGQTSVKDLLKALCLEYQLGYPQPRNAQECVDLANSVLQSSMLEFAQDRIVQSSIGVSTQNGFKVNLQFIEEEESEEEEDSGVLP
jgi:hypothetical protein